MLKVVETKNGVTKCKALSSDVILVDYQDLGKGDVYINGGVGTWDDNNPKEDTPSGETVQAETYSLTEANAEMNKIRNTSNVKYFE